MLRFAKQEWGTASTAYQITLSPGNGSATSEDLFWKLDALQKFVYDLHWPEPEFAQHLEQRLKLMASDMVEACVKRTRVAFEAKMQKASKSTEYRVSPSICTMFNVLMDAKKQCIKLCTLEGGQEQQYHSTIDDLIEDAFKEMISLLVSKKPGMDLADTYITFVRQNQDILRDKVNEEIYIEKVFDKTYRDFRLQGVLEGTLNNKAYDTIYNRLTLEEATVSVTDGSGLQGISMRDSDEEDE
ncbi:CAPS2 protein, partial [Polypterus senegalus]